MRTKRRPIAIIRRSCSDSSLAGESTSQRIGFSEATTVYSITSSAVATTRSPPERRGAGLRLRLGRVGRRRPPEHPLTKRSPVVVDEARQRGLLPRRDPIGVDLRGAFPRLAERLVIEEETSACASKTCRTRWSTALAQILRPNISTQGARLLPRPARQRAAGPQSELTPYNLQRT
jgi:hypothetical protein